ncbi:MAG: flavodoxin family protein [Lautropia sp.]
MTRIVIAAHSGYGHTRKVADALVAGAAGIVRDGATLLDVATIDEAGWARLAAADAIVFGAPTYMGGASAQFKAFADASAPIWLAQGWKDKIAGGFTCSLNMSGDKSVTLHYFVTLAMQHSMIWVGTGLLPPQTPGAPDELNRLGSSVGVMAQAGNVSPELEPPAGDLETARVYGQRIATITRRLRG